MANKPTGAIATVAAAKLHRRRLLQAAMGGAALAATGLAAPPVVGQARRFAGVTLNGACFQHVFHTWLRDLLPEFEAQSGMKVNLDIQAFPVYNQRMDLELSTGGSAYDFCNITFIYSGRWIGSGWMSPLDPFVRNPNLTPADWNPDDFLPGPQASLRDARGQTYGYCWEAGAMVMSASRGDLLDQSGVQMPKTFAELEAACRAVHGKDGSAAFVNDNLHHWNFIPYLMGLGGKVFRGPPGDLMPMLDTPEAIAAAEYYANLITKFGPPGLLSYTNDQSVRAQMLGRGNFRTTAIDWFTPLVRHADSTVKSTVRFAPMPVGPKGDFTGSSSHGYGIPANARQKEAAWEFIKWAMSRETLLRLVREKGYGTVSRRSIITDPAFRSNMTLNGHDVASMFLKVLDQIGASDYMNYRSVSVFPQVGDKINKAIEAVASGQMGAAAAMRQAQTQAIADLKRSGVPI
ncbi:MAG: extracellular solute-binding protein [Tagaea sp.]|nr:extracellular solute-binding protein [Tagaea sp.]